jgi:Lysyl oxidase
VIPHELRLDVVKDRRPGVSFPLSRTAPQTQQLLQLGRASGVLPHRDAEEGQFLLAFSAGIMNLGARTLNVVGYRDPVAGNVPDPNTMPAYQRIFHADGTCDELPVGTMEYHNVHHHWHLEGVMKYELLNANGKPVKPNTKVAFCLADVAQVDSSLPGFPTAPAFNGCDPNQSTTYVNMGTSIGWEDIYDKMLSARTSTSPTS